MPTSSADPGPTAPSAPTTSGSRPTAPPRSTPSSSKPAWNSMPTVPANAASSSSKTPTAWRSTSRRQVGGGSGGRRLLFARGYRHAHVFAAGGGVGTGAQGDQAVHQRQQAEAAVVGADLGSAHYAGLAVQRHVLEDVERRGDIDGLDAVGPDRAADVLEAAVVREILLPHGPV